MADNTDLIKEKLDIVDFVKDYIELTKAGRNFKGLCPFHKEKTPSFMVSPDRQIFHCFGCGVGGDMFSFLMQYENIEFLDALKILADKAGVELTNFTSDQKKYENLYAINRVAKDFFRRNLGDEGAKVARAYLKKRGLTSETVNEFEIGLAGSEKDLLVRHLTGMGYRASEVEMAGLAFKTKQGTYWDRFRDRLMFPINNHFSKTVGFTGRQLPGKEDEKSGKYVNSPETPLFNKSKLLFGFDKTKNFIREADTAVIVEGQMDAIMAYQDGVKNVVASSGTALTEGHLTILRRLAENLVLAFDSDSAGMAAAERTIDLAQSADFNVRVLEMNDEALKDPADLVKAKPGELAQKVAGAVPAMEYYFSLYDVLAGEIADKKKNIRSVLAKIKGIASAVEQSHWLGRLANRSNMPEKVLAVEMAGLKSGASGSSKKADDGEAQDGNVLKKLDRQDRICQRLIALAVQDEELAKRLKGEYLELLGEKYEPVLEYSLSDKKEEPSESIRGLVNLVFLQADAVPVGTTEEDQASSGKKYGTKNQPVDLTVEFDSLIDQLKGMQVSSRRKELVAKIAVAEAAKDEVELEKLLKEYSELTQE